MKDMTNGSGVTEMESELIAIGLVLLAVAAILMVAVGSAPTPVDLHGDAARMGCQAHLLVTQVAARLPW